MMHHEFHFSTLPRELQDSTLDWVDMRESLCLLAVSWPLRWHVLENGAFTKALCSLDIRLDHRHAHAHYCKGSGKSLPQLMTEAPPINFQVTTRHFEGDPWRFDEWNRPLHLENVQRIISMLRYCPQLRISGGCLFDGHLSFHYPRLRLEHFVPRHVAHIDRLWLDCRLGYYVDISRVLADTRIDLAIIDTCQAYQIITTQDIDEAEEQLREQPPPDQVARVERVVFAPRHQHDEALMLRLFELWRPREIIGVLLGRGGPVPRSHPNRHRQPPPPPPIGDRELFVRWVRAVLGQEKIPGHPIQLLLPLADHAASTGLLEELASIFGDELTRRHLLETYRDDQHHFAEPRAEWWLKFTPKHPPKTREEPTRSESHAVPRSRRIRAKLYQEVVMRG